MPNTGTRVLESGGGRQRMIREMRCETQSTVAGSEDGGAKSK